MQGQTRSAEVNWLGWWLVVIGFVALAVSFSVRAVLGLAMPAIARELDWSSTGLSAVGAGALIVMAAASPLAGRVIDLSGPRALMSGGLLLVALGAGVVASTSSTFAFALGFGLIAALGFAALAGAAALLAALAWGTLKVGRMAEAAGTGGDQSLAAGVGGLLREPVFHLLFWSFLLCGFTTTGVIETHLLPYAAFCGFPPLQSATAYGVLSAVNLVGMVSAGWLADRVNRPRLLGLIYIGRALAFLLLIQFAVGTPDLALLLSNQPTERAVAPAAA